MVPAAWRLEPPDANRFSDPRIEYAACISANSRASRPCWPVRRQILERHPGMRDVRRRNDGSVAIGDSTTARSCGSAVENTTKRSGPQHVAGGGAVRHRDQNRVAGLVRNAANSNGSETRPSCSSARLSTPAALADDGKPRTGRHEVVRRKLIFVE